MICIPQQPKTTTFILKQLQSSTQDPIDLDSPVLIFNVDSMINSCNQAHPIQRCIVSEIAYDFNRQLESSQNVYCVKDTTRDRMSGSKQHCFRRIGLDGTNSRTGFSTSMTVTSPSPCLDISNGMRLLPGTSGWARLTISD